MLIIVKLTGNAVFFLLPQFQMCTKTGKYKESKNVLTDINQPKIISQFLIVQINIAKIKIINAVYMVYKFVCFFTNV